MSHVLYPAEGETFGALVRRVMQGLTPGLRARVQVVTGGERSGLVVPETASPVIPPPAAGESTAAKKPGASRRRATTGTEAD